MRRPFPGARAALALAVLVCAVPGALRAQRAGGPAAADCPYSRCALGISPAWNGLLVVRGPERAREANLNFFLPREIGAAFAGDSARAYASRAVATRRAAAVFTDFGALLLAVAAARAGAAGRLDRAGRVTAVAGAAAFVVGVPLQFSADGLLARAVWWHNARFAR